MLMLILSALVERLVVVVVYYGEHGRIHWIHVMSIWTVGTVDPPGQDWPIGHLRKAIGLQVI